MPTKYTPNRKCYVAREVASMLGMSTENLYRKDVLEGLQKRGFPESLTLGRYRFPIDLVDAWFKRNPRPAPPANDTIASPPIAHEADDKQREFIHRAYAR